SCVDAGPGWKISTTHSTGSKQRFIGNGPQCRSKARYAPQEISGPILIITLQDLLHHMLHQLPTSMLWASHSIQPAGRVESGDAIIMAQLELCTKRFWPQPSGGRASTVFSPRSQTNSAVGQSRSDL